MNYSGNGNGKPERVYKSQNIPASMHLCARSLCPFYGVDGIFTCIIHKTQDRALPEWYRRIGTYEGHPMFAADFTHPEYRQFIQANVVDPSLKKAAEFSHPEK